MSWLEPFEFSENIWDDSFSDLEITSIDPDLQPLHPISGTLDDIAQQPDISHSSLKQVDLEFQHPKHWSKEEDDLLTELVEQFNQDWSTITQSFPYKNPKAVIKRWMQKNSPTAKSKWTPEEDEIILDCYTKYGGVWNMMSKRLKGRLPECIKNRFYGTLKKRLSREQKESIDLHKAIASKRLRPWGKEDEFDIDFESASMKEVSESVDLGDRSRKVDSLYKKIAAIEAFISKTRIEIKQLNTKNTN